MTDWKPSLPQLNARLLVPILIVFEVLKVCPGMVRVSIPVDPEYVPAVISSGVVVPIPVITT